MNPSTKNLIEMFLWIGGTAAYWAYLVASPTYYSFLSPENLVGLALTWVASYKVRKHWDKV